MAGIKPLARVKSDDPAIASIQVHAEQLDRVPLLAGQLVTGIVRTGLQSVVVNHSLERAFQGGLPAGASIAIAHFVRTPAAALASGLDITRQLSIHLSSVAAQDVTVNVWVF